MKKFSAPIMEIQRLVPEDVFTASDCRTEALGCPSCYGSAIECEGSFDPCTGAQTEW